MARDITTVIARILAEIPAEQAELRADLERIGRNALYHPPEAHHRDWTFLCDRLEEFDREICAPFVGRPAWLERVRLIVTGEA